MHLPFTRSRREAAERRGRQVPLTDTDPDDILTISLAAARTVGCATTPQVEVAAYRGGVIVQFRQPIAWRNDAVPVIRRALEVLGYVLADGDAGRGTVIVTGRDPQHPLSNRPAGAIT